ncbi:hypothetical protein ACR9GP_25870 [Enterobacter ludwigii]
MPDGTHELYIAPPAPVVPEECAVVVEYLESDLEADGEFEAEGSIEAKRLLSRSDAMFQGKAKSQPDLPDWHAEAERFAEMYGASFVIFRYGENPVCVDPTKFWFGFDPAEPEQDT